jgi:hypothetical protein
VDYLPLSEGNEWYMDAVMETSTGEIKKGTAHRVFEETVKQDGQTYLRSRTTIEFPPFGRQEYTKLVRKDEKGFYTIKEPDPAAPVQAPPKDENASGATSKAKAGAAASPGPVPDVPQQTRDDSAREQLEIPLPLTVGRQWERSDGTRMLRDRVIGIETLEIGGITFHDCFHIRSEAVNEKMQQDYWEAPNTGNIKSVSLLPNGVRITVTLHEFKPGTK